jgi:hypothetical protein
MRIEALAAVIFFALAGPAAQQRGAVGGVRVVPAGAGNDLAVSITVTGASPCGAVHIEYGDGNAITHATTTLPVVFAYEYAKPGNYRVVARGMGNCNGTVATQVRVTAAGGRIGGPGEIRFAVMDSNRDGRITRQEWRGSDQSFRVHDWNGDGVLEGDEVRPGARRPYREDDFTEDYVFNEWTERGFRTLDRDRNNRVTRAEWPYDIETFLRVDRNRDNALTLQEFVAADMDDDRGDRFDYLDVNRNGRIEWSEWHGTRDAFEWLDRNNDNALSRAEVLGEPTSEWDQFNSLDVNRDRVLSRDEWAWSPRSFQQRDSNGDGVLTRAEFAGAAPAGPAGETVTVTVLSTQRWIDTGLTVQAGEMVSFKATGTIYMTSGSDDAANPQGSVTGRQAQGAPLPRELAGMLIGRVENAPPFAIGDRTQRIRMARAGRLYLGVNDDFFADNRGEYRVTISLRR